MKKLLLSMLMLLLFYACSWAQRKITGEVYDRSLNQPLIGATVVAGQQGTVTDTHGRFSLELPNGNKSITVSSVGYASEVINVGTATFYRIGLDLSEHSLNQLVVVGYGEQKRANLTGAVSTVDVEKTFVSKPLTDATKALQGVVPGLSILYGNGGLTAAPVINLRGIGSVNGNSAPLILVDNVPTPDLSIINPLDIASISVLKDAASACIYGARAAFGVILIKTKSGHINRPTQVTYSDNFSWNTP